MERAMVWDVVLFLSPSLPQLSKFGYEKEDEGRGKSMNIPDGAESKGKSLCTLMVPTNSSWGEVIIHHTANLP